MTWRFVVVDWILIIVELFNVELESPHCNQIELRKAESEQNEGGSESVVTDGTPREKMFDCFLRIELFGVRADVADNSDTAGWDEEECGDIILWNEALS